ncbi:DUF747-domain-containing protein [Pluteus cervinus]|uniref:DUF747-domain-containing protein n=1 Tax=Pluteus cervinus TaxID=181527 RepID=A0ACD3B905_9AGAR|nr:DUF747-domain-containing protein [Pluteus cervinus]
MTARNSPTHSRKVTRRYSSASSGGWARSFNSTHSRGRPTQGDETPPGIVTDNELSYLPPGLTDGSDNESDFPSIASDPLFRRTPSRPLIYASLPPTPISRSPTVGPVKVDTPIPPLTLNLEPEPEIAKEQVEPEPEPPFSLWDYLREELLATDFDSHQELKWERVSNFLQIPVAMEKIIGFGFILCLDSFLYTFTILPIRFFLGLFRLLGNVLRITSPPLPPAQKADILRALLLIGSFLILEPLTDASKIYHTIRGQDTIKLYVIFNALEIADRLCASIGQDIFDCLFSRSTLEPLTHRIPVTSHTFRPLLFFVLATLYNVAHSLVMVYQLIAMNVAVNSYDHALLTLLVSNQFVEIKGSVFKKFEKDSLFQITCADIVERFCLTLMLCIVALRNLVELSGSEFDPTVLPKSFGWFPGNNVLWTISYPVLTVLLSEMLVDWLKHAFITKFNHIRPSVYERYTDVLCRDLACGSAVGRKGRKHAYVDQSPLVARRLGFASLPLAVVAILIGRQSISLMFSVQFEAESPALPILGDSELANTLKWATMGILVWLCFLGVKVILGVKLISYATHRRAGMEKRAAEDAINDFGRDPIGEGKEERNYNRDLKTLLDNKQDDAPPLPELGERNPKDKPTKGKKGRVELEDLTRFTMVKRIW